MYESIFKMVQERLSICSDYLGKWCADESGHYRYGRKEVEAAVRRTLITLAVERAHEATDAMVDMKNEDIRSILVQVIANLFQQITEPAFIRKVTDEVMEDLRRGGATYADWRG
ncbi:MAG: hypothetical protein JSS14_02365 [Proteobacteria bacterium]|nr:hypothetical protein [Pseudomonadota bacterium]